jgi:hypothetical protein
MDRNDKMMVVGLAMLITAAFLYLGFTALLEFVRKDFEVSDAKYYTDFHETVINLTYHGSSPVSVSVYKEFYFDGRKTNQTENIGVMNRGDWYTIGFHGYVTWCEVIYNENQIKLTFSPKQTTVSDSPP